MGANPTVMGIKRAIGDLRELHRSVVELFDDDRSAEAEASLQIARSAQRFSQNTKEVVDDKLSFSATLMRAGEVQAANRLLAEVEHDVREEEAALIETVNEVKVAQSLRRERVTRLRLAKMLAVATVGSALLTFSAAGMAVAGFLRDRAEEIARPSDETGSTQFAARPKATGAGADKTRRLRIGDVDVVLTKSQFKTLKELTGGATLDADGLEELLGVLPAPLAQRIEEAITVASTQVQTAETEVETVVAAADKALVRKRRAAKKAAAEAQQAEEQEQEQETPAEEPTPQPTPSEEKKNGGSEEEDGGDTGGTPEEEEGDGGPPLPIEP